MPSRNTIREDVPDNYFHVYSRGANKQTVFLDKADYEYFEGLLERYLSKKQQLGKNGYAYPNYHKKIELLAFCLMSNHFHLLVYQNEAGAITALLKSLATSYSMYFNLKYKHSGSVFESRYKCSRIITQDYLEHISRYIHLNPRHWEQYKHSSLMYYTGTRAPEWLRPSKITDMFSTPGEYLGFMKDYEDHKRILGDIKQELANT